jgi:DNA invertase Pin-like site-specific DNA recombinase
MRIAYARVSREDQTLDLQRDALLGARCDQIYEEHASGKNTDRPELAACLKALRSGDALVVWRLDRLGRSLTDLVEIIAQLKSRGIDFESLTEKIETFSPAGQLIFHIFAALAQFERSLIRERVMAGLKAARARGRKGGRPKKLRPKDKLMIETLRKDPNLSLGEIAARFGVSRSTLYRNGA